MAYLRISDDAMDHPKLSALSDGTHRFWFNANCWCQKHLTNGRIPKTSLQDIPRYKPGRVRELVAAGLWRSDHDVYVVHDFLCHNDSREVVEERRRKKAERMESWRERRRGQLVDAPRDTPQATAVDKPQDAPRDKTEPSPSPPPHLSGSKEPHNGRAIADGAGERLWEAWRSVMASRVRLSLQPSQTEAMKLLEAAQRVPDEATLRSAMERFVRLEEADRKRLNIKTLTLGYFVMALPDLVIDVQPQRCRHGHNPPCNDDTECTQRYLAEVRAS